MSARRVDLHDPLTSLAKVSLEYWHLNEARPQRILLGSWAYASVAEQFEADYGKDAPKCFWGVPFVECDRVVFDEVAVQ